MAVYEQTDPKTGESFWYFDFKWQDPGKKPRRIRARAKDEKQRPCHSKTAAEAAENRKRAELARGQGLTTETPSEPEELITLGQFKARFFDEHVAKLKASTQDAQATIWNVSLLPTLKGADIKSIGEVEYSQVATVMRKAGRSPKTINNALSSLRMALETARAWRLRGPIAPVKWEKVPEPEIEWFEDEAIEALIATGDVMVTFALKTGLRLGELLALRWSDVHMKAATVTISKSVWWSKGEAHEGATKSGRIRVVPLPRSAIEALKKLTQGIGTAYVFTTERGLQLTKGETKWPLYRACDAAGVGRCGWHKLRHSYVSALVRKNVPLPQVQKLAGHARIEMTMRYTHVNDAELKRAVSVLA